MCDKIITLDVVIGGTTISREAMRTHVIVPRELVESVDELVGKRSRSRFFTDAVAEKLARAKLIKAARKVAGSLANIDTPGWETSESTVEWVRASRRKDDERVSRMWEEK